MSTPTAPNSNQSAREEAARALLEEINGWTSDGIQEYMGGAAVELLEKLRERSCFGITAGELGFLTDIRNCLIDRELP